MSSQEDREKRRKRMRVRSKIAQDLITNPRYKKKVVADKKKKIDVQKLTHAELVKLINEKEDSNGE